ncbi:Adaptive-response sensory-kinase SasA [Streptomyces hirsutus]
MIARRPQVALIDELAHTNIPGSTHTKRWQDVEQILEAGITVISTVNIQHLESLNDVMQQIAGVLQRETLPDEVVRRADQVELVDMTAEALRRRMVLGTTPPETIDAALSDYFEGADDVAVAKESFQRLDRVVAGLLDMSRLQAGTPGASRGPVAVEDIVTRAVESLGQPGHDLDLLVPDDIPDVFADPVLVEQILVTLISQAQRSSPPGRPVLLTAAARDKRVELRVVDRGPGISAAERARVVPSLPAPGSGGRPSRPHRPRPGTRPRARGGHGLPPHPLQHSRRRAHRGPHPARRTHSWLGSGSPGDRHAHVARARRSRRAEPRPGVAAQRYPPWP